MDDSTRSFDALARTFLAARGPEVFRWARGLDPSRAARLLTALEEPSAVLERLDEAVLEHAVRRLPLRFLAALAGTAGEAGRKRIEREIGEELSGRLAGIEVVAQDVEDARRELAKAIEDARRAGHSTGVDFRAALGREPCRGSFESPAEVGLYLHPFLVEPGEPIEVLVRAPARTARPLRLVDGLSSRDELAVLRPDEEGWAWGSFQPAAHRPGPRSILVLDEEGRALASAACAVAIGRDEAGVRVRAFDPDSGRIELGHDGPASRDGRLEVYCGACARQVDEVALEFERRIARAGIDAEGHSGPLWLECFVEGVRSVTLRLPPAGGPAFPAREDPPGPAAGRLQARSSEPATLARWLATGRHVEDPEVVARLVETGRVSLRAGGPESLHVHRAPPRATDDAFHWVELAPGGEVESGFRAAVRRTGVSLDFPEYLDPADRIVGRVRVRPAVPGMLTIADGTTAHHRVESDQAFDVALEASHPIAVRWEPDGGAAEETRWNAAHRLWSGERLRLALAGDRLEAGTRLHDPVVLADGCLDRILDYPFG